MAKISGKAGQVDAASEVTGIKSWTLDYTIDTLDTTDFDDAGVRTYIVGCSSWSGSFEGYKDGTPLPLAGDAVTIKLYESQTASQFWTGSAFITGIHTNTSHDGIVTYAYDFQGTGALTVAAA
jgi:predicted secreted protein